MEKYMITIMGCSLDNDNRGVTALAYSLLHIFSYIIESDSVVINYLVPDYEKASNTIKCNNKTIQVNKLIYRMKPTSNKTPNILLLTLISLITRLCVSNRLRLKVLKKNSFFKEILDSNIVCDIYGGDSFSDIYGLKNYLKNTWLRILINSIGCKIVYLPQTYGPFYSRLSRFIYKKLYKDSLISFSRDYESIDLIKHIAGRSFCNEKLLFCPDVAFSLPFCEVEDLVLKKAIKSNKKTIGLNISGLLYYSEENESNNIKLNLNYKKLIIEIINYFLMETDNNILFIPHVYNVNKNEVKLENDLKASKDVIIKLSDEYSDRLLLIDKDYTQIQLKFIIGQCDFFMGSRMHACIAAMSQGIPTIGLAYSRKFIGVFGALDLNDYVIDMTDKTTEDIIVKIINLFDENEFSILSKVEDVKNQIFYTFRNHILK